MSTAQSRSEFPSLAMKRRLDSLEISKTHSIVLVKLGAIQCVVVAATRSLPVLIRVVDMPDAESIDQVYAELKKRVAEGEGGEQRLLRIEHRELFFRRLCSPPRFTLGLALLFSLLFWRTEAWLDSTQLGERVHFGAFVIDLIGTGEVFRLVTSNFLHQSWPHLINNLTGLVLFGWLVEAAIGAKRTALLLFLSGAFAFSMLPPLFGSREEFLFVNLTGSSALVWGLVGASAVITTRRRRDLPVGFRVPVFIWGMIAVNLVSQRDFEIISIVVHLSGGALGLLAMIFLTRNNRALPLPDAPRLTPILVAVLSIVVLAGAFAVRNDRLYGMQTYFNRIHQRLASAATSDPLRNDFAWILAVASEVPERSMELALDVMQGVVARDPKAAFRDTLATLYYRTGDPQRAVEIARAIRWEASSAFATVQLARFYAAAHPATSRGAPVSSESLASVDAFVEIAVIRSEVPEVFEFVPTLLGQESAPAFLHALVYQNRNLYALFELNVDWFLQGGRCQFPLSEIPGFDFDALTARAVWVGPPDSSAASLVKQCKLTVLHSDVRRLP